jgi:hypothetical protein
MFHDILIDQIKLKLINGQPLKNRGQLGEFTMVSQPIRLILVDWFVVFFFVFF